MPKSANILTVSYEPCEINGNRSMYRTTEPKYISDTEASLRTGLSLSWSRRMRLLKQGPPYVKCNSARRGAVLYPVNELDHYFADRLVLNATFRWLN